MTPRGGSGESIEAGAHTVYLGVPPAWSPELATYGDWGADLKAPYASTRRIRIVAECARLESVYRETYRGFKSRILRQLKSINLERSHLAGEKGG